MWTFEGFGIKFIDQIIDEEREPPKWIFYLLFISLGIGAGFTMNIDKFSLSGSIALIIGLIIAKKIDSKIWYELIILIIASYFLFLFSFLMFNGINAFELIPVSILVIILAVLSYLDEISHEYFNKLHNILIKNILERRLLMKIGVIILAFIFDFIFWYHVVGWILFDLTYDITGVLYKKREYIQLKEYNYLPKTILWDFTKNCNLQCVYCYNDYSNEKQKYTNSILYGIKSPSKQPDLSIDQIRQKILPQFKEMKVKSLCLSGGEPLLRFNDIINLAPDFYRIGLEEILIDTNGTLLNQKRIELIKKAYKKIPYLYFSIPLDSLNPLEMAELRPPMKDILKKTQNSIELVLKNKLVVTVETVITKVNFDEMEAIINFSKEKGRKCLAEIYPMFSVGRARKRDDLLLNYAELQEFDRLKIKNYGKCLTWDFMPFIPKKEVWEKVKNKAKIAQITEGCIAGREYLQLDHAGNVYPCSFLRLYCGNLLIDSLKDIWEQNEILIKFRNRQITGKCGICKYKQECGGCRARAYTETGDPYGGVESCEGGPNGHPLEEIFTQKLKKIYKIQYLYMREKELFKKKWKPIK